MANNHLPEAKFLAGVNEAASSNQEDVPSTSINQETGGSGTVTNNAAKTTTFNDSNGTSGTKQRDPSGFLSGLQKRATHILSNSSLSQAKSDAKKVLQKNEQKLAKKITKNWQRVTGIAKENSKKDFITSKNLSCDDSNKYRRGPLAVEDFPNGNRNMHQTNHGMIDSDDEDGRVCRPSSKGLLRYFKELGQNGDEDETVDLDFVASLFEAGADANHADRLVFLISFQKMLIGQQISIQFWH